MNLRNPFSEETRLLFFDVKHCFRCKRTDRGWEGDHIFGRVSNSPLNFSPLCPPCHFNKARYGYAGKIQQMRWTSEFLAKSGYKLTKKDLEFLEDIKRQ